MVSKVRSAGVLHGRVGKRGGGRGAGGGGSAGGRKMRECGLRQPSSIPSCIPSRPPSGMGTPYTNVGILHRRARFVWGAHLVPKARRQLVRRTAGRKHHRRPSCQLALLAAASIEGEREAAAVVVAHVRDFGLCHELHVRCGTDGRRVASRVSCVARGEGCARGVGARTRQPLAAVLFVCGAVCRVRATVPRGG